MENLSTTSRELEELWRRRTEIAYQRYAAAKQAARDAIERLPDVSGSNRTYDLLDALRAERLAFAEYRQVLKMGPAIPSFEEII